MSVGTNTPTTTPPSSAVTAATPNFDSTHINPAQPAKPDNADKEPGHPDAYFLAQSSGDMILKLGTASALKQPRGHGPISKLKSWFSPHNKADEEEEIEIVLPAAALSTSKGNYASIRPQINLENQGPVPDWQSVIDKHVRHDASGHAIGEDGRPIDITHMNAAFGEKLAQVCIQLDAQGYAGKYEIISGVRSKEDQQRIYNYYKQIGSNHPVALPGNSLHELGCAVDIKCIGGDSASFFNAYHGAALQAGCGLVANDREHIQLPRNEVHNFIMQQNTGSQSTPGYSSFSFNPAFS